MPVVRAISNLIIKAIDNRVMTIVMLDSLLAAQHSAYIVHSSNHLFFSVPKCYTIRYYLCYETFALNVLQTTSERMFLKEDILTVIVPTFIDSMSMKVSASDATTMQLLNRVCIVRNNSTSVLVSSTSNYFENVDKTVLINGGASTKKTVPLLESLRTVNRSACIAFKSDG